MTARWLTLLLCLAGALTHAQDGGVTPAPTTVAVDFTQLPPATWTELEVLTLEKKVLVRLVQDGFAVMAKDAGAMVRLTVSRRENTLVLGASTCAREQTTDVPLGAAPLGELHLEVAQRLAALARRCAPPPDEPRPPTSGDAPAPAAPPPSKGLRLGGSMGFFFRAGGTDPVLRAAVRYGRTLGVEVTAGLVLSGVTEVTVFEVPVLVALSLHLDLGKGFALEAALAAGVFVHTFLLADPARTDRAGVRVDVMASLPVTLSFSPLSWGGIGLRVAPSLVSGVHPRGGWTRGLASVEACGLAFLKF
ncbi:MAG: hypothetical protein JNJ54_10290 [Myxococcaceae bacterium]|nr:hypothetical protein [Myxococcaceae bacterium]